MYKVFYIVFWESGETYRGSTLSNVSLKTLHAIYNPNDNLHIYFVGRHD